MNFVAGTDWLAVQLHLFAVALCGGLLLGGCWQAYGLLFRPLRRARRNWLGPDAVFALLMLGLLLLWWFSLTDGSLRAADFLWLGLGLVISLVLPWPQPRRRYGSRVLKSTRAKLRSPAKSKAASSSRPETATRDGTAAEPGISIAGGPALVMATRAALAVATRARSISARRRQRRQERREASRLAENQDESEGKL